jgi:hypothetical protein
MDPMDEDSLFLLFLLLTVALCLEKFLSHGGSTPSWCNKKTNLLQGNHFE